MAGDGSQIAFFFIRFRNFASSYSVNLFHGAHRLPGTASSGGGTSANSAFEVLIPAMDECTFVPGTPGGRTRGGLGVPFSFGILGGFGVRGLPVPFCRSLGFGASVLGGDSQSDGSLGGGESGLGGGRTSPGTIILRPRTLGAVPTLCAARFSATGWAFLISGDFTGSGVGSRDGGMGMALSFWLTKSSRARSFCTISAIRALSAAAMRLALSMRL